MTEYSEIFETSQQSKKIEKSLFKQNPWNTFLGDCSVVDEFLLTRPVLSRKWIFLHAFNVFLRAVGQPAFVNNPLCGILIFGSLFIQDPQVGLGCLLGGLLAVGAEMFLRIQPWDLMRNGVAAFNAVLVGTVISCLYPEFYQGTSRSLEMWLFITFGALLSIFLCSALNNFLGKVGLPYLALPFNLIITCSFITIQPDNVIPMQTLDQDFFNDSLINFTNSSLNETTKNLIDVVEAKVGDADVDWSQVGRGILVSMSQVYAINDIPTSIIMNIAVAMASPLLFVMCTVGATIGSFLGVAFLPSTDLTEVYDGLWGYNPLLTMAAISCVFFSCNHYSIMLGFMASLATSVVQFALRENMTLQNNLPVFTMPMTLVTLVFLLTTNQGNSLHRVTEPSYPEKQAYLWFTRHRKIPQEDAA